MSKNTAYIFGIGRELLEGLILDRNANFLASKLSEAGCRVTGIQILGHDKAAMVAAFERVIQDRTAYVFTSGGMGPGHDDITRECVAMAAKLPLVEDAGAVEMVAKSYRRLAAKGIVEDPALTEERKKVALLPRGALYYENPIGTAPAVELAVGDTTFFLLPGVPAEMQHMFAQYLLPALKSKAPGSYKRAVHIDYPGRDESALTRVLADMARRYHGVHTKARVQPDSGIRITLFGENTDAGDLDQILERAEADLRARLGLEVSPETSGDRTAD